ncbi:MAG TPA: hypothetical protein VHT49_10455 [Acidimicrobiales bacterium]|jgi:hypothetical protein|nr:hypothetical protein [Acidimicrobiales bacterium]
MTIEVFKANPEDRDSPVAELRVAHDGTVDVSAQVFSENGELMIAIFARAGGVEWQFPLSEFVEAIHTGESMLEQ